MSLIVVDKNAVITMLELAWPHTMLCGLARRRLISVLAERVGQVQAIVTGFIRLAFIRVTWTNLRYPKY
jgi:hypothetical protein